MIQLALLVDAPARALRKTYEEQIEEPMRQAYAKLADARFAIYGTDVYPDATFTLRLAFGLVKGYTDGGRAGPAVDDLHGPLRAGPGTGQPVRRSSCPNDGSSARAGSTWTRLSISSPRPTSSAATPAARSSTATARSSGSSSTGTSSRWSWTSSTRRNRPAPSPSTRRRSSKPCERSTTPTAWSKSCRRVLRRDGRRALADQRHVRLLRMGIAVNPLRALRMWSHTFDARR